MIATEQGGRGAEEHRGRSAFLDRQVEQAMHRLLELEGVHARSRLCTVGTSNLHFLEAGVGPTVLLLHGAGGGAANWYRLMAPLARSFHLIALDLPGFGLSDSVQPNAPLGGQIARLVADFLNTIAVQPVHVIGTSFGGLVAARLAPIIAPTTVTLIDAAGLWPEASLGLKLACVPFFQRLGLKQTRRGARWALRHVLTSGHMRAEHEAALAEYIYASAARSDIRMLARAYALFGSLRGQREVLTENELYAIGQRTLIIWGAQDRFLPAPPAGRARALAAGARLHIIPGAGHSPNWEAPNEVLEAIFDFLDDTRGDTEA